jgi:hypothetical protein
LKSLNLSLLVSLIGKSYQISQWIAPTSVQVTQLFGDQSIIQDVKKKERKRHEKHHPLITHRFSENQKRKV